MSSPPTQDDAQYAAIAKFAEVAYREDAGMLTAATLQEYVMAFEARMADGLASPEGRQALLDALGAERIGATIRVGEAEEQPVFVFPSTGEDE